MYMLTIKNRKNEIRAVKMLRENGLLDEGLLPLVEVIVRKTKCDKAIDKETGKLARINKPYKTGSRKGEDRWVTYDDPSTERDVTLEEISDLFPNMTVLVDYYRADMKKHKEADHSKCELTLKLNNSLDDYVSCIKEIARFPQLVPVITIKNGIDRLSPIQVKELIRDLRLMNEDRPLAVRAESIDGYEEVLENSLTSSDFFIYDINEAPLASRVVEMDELEELDLSAQKILLCSPRKRDIKNGKYAESCLIDGDHITDYASYGFDGVGDYAGLRDVLPGTGGGTGCALALLYNGEGNRFHAYVNEDYTLGQDGFETVVHQVYSDRDKLEKHEGECLVLQRVAQWIANGEHGGWQSWIANTIVRYVQQLYLAHGNSYFI